MKKEIKKLVEKLLLEGKLEYNNKDALFFSNEEYDVYIDLKLLRYTVFLNDLVNHERYEFNYFNWLGYKLITYYLNLVLEIKNDKYKKTLNVINKEEK